MTKKYTEEEMIAKTLAYFKGYEELHSGQYDGEAQFFKLPTGDIMAFHNDGWSQWFSTHNPYNDKDVREQAFARAKAIREYCLKKIDDQNNEIE